MMTDRALNALQPRDESYRVNDGSGQSIVIEITPSGSKLARLRYRWNGKQRQLALGNYPDVKLVEIRRRAGEARQLIEEGKDPGAVRRVEKERKKIGSLATFEAVASVWHEESKAELAEATLEKHNSFLTRDIYPIIGSTPIADIKPTDIVRVIDRIKARGAHDIAKRSFSLCRTIMGYAVAKGLADRNPAADLNSAHLLKGRPKTRHHAAPTEPAKLGEVLRAIDGFGGTLVVKAALQLAPLLAVRPGELRGAEWAEIDLEKGEWNIPAERMKLRLPHLVPLSPQAVAILRDLHNLTGHGKFAFPCERTGSNRSMSENAITAALRRLGFSKDEVTGHGLRASFRTIADEVLGERPDLLEFQLSHTVRDANGRAYNRTKFIEDRKALMIRWSDYCDQLKAA